jgi:ABC-type nitrate/sulfonate/bicarbonate transport system substrate-binding protein
VRAFLNGHSLKLIAAIASQNDTQFVASRDSGITVEVDIRDKRVAVEPDGREEYMLDRFLTINGLSRKDLDVRHMASSDAANAMLSGSIDAAMLHDTYAYAITTKMGTRCVSWPGQEGLSDYSVLIASSEFAEKHKPEIKSIFKALREAEQYVEKEPEQAMKVAKISNLGERVEAERWQNMDVRLELEQALLLTMDYEAQWLFSRGYGKGNIPSTYRLLDMAGLEEVCPSSVTVTH